MADAVYTVILNELSKIRIVWGVYIKSYGSLSYRGNVCKRLRITNMIFWWSNPIMVLWVEYIWSDWYIKIFKILISMYLSNWQILLKYVIYMNYYWLKLSHDKKTYETKYLKPVEMDLWTCYFLHAFDPPLSVANGVMLWAQSWVMRSAMST